MATLIAQLEQLTALKHRLAVWEAIYRWADEKFISKDGRKASGLRVPNCLEEIVPEDTVDSVLQAIGSGPILELQEQISAIENREVVIIDHMEAAAKA